MKPPVPHFEKPRIPIRPLLLSFGALAVPSIVTLFFAGVAGPWEAFLWFVALVPAFLLAYYRGWRGVATAMVVGGVVIALVQLGLLGLGRGGERDGLFAGVITAYIGVGLGLGILSELIHRERQEAEAAALTDPLTGIPNRRYAELVLPREFAGAKRGREFSVVVFDLDNFKAFNDEHGHSAGDEALIAFAHAVESNTRTMNLSARVGGEEFLSIASSTTAEGAVVFAERVRKALADNPPPSGPLTVSAGIAEYDDTMKRPDDLLEAADRALYRAKSEGRDRVAIHKP